MWEASKQKWNGFEPRESVIIGKEEERKGQSYHIVTYRYFMIRYRSQIHLKCFIACSYPDFLNILPYPDPMLTALHTLELWHFLGTNKWVRSAYITQTCLSPGTSPNFMTLLEKINGTDQILTHILSPHFPPSYLNRGTKTDTSWW